MKHVVLFRFVVRQLGEREEENVARFFRSLNFDKRINGGKRHAHVRRMKDAALAGAEDWVDLVDVVNGAAVNATGSRFLQSDA